MMRLSKLMTILLVTLFMVSCSKEEAKEVYNKIKDNADKIIPIDDGQGDDGSNLEAPVVIFTQDFESFQITGNWFLSDFNLPGEANKADYTEDGVIKFDIRWTKRTRNHLADLLVMKEVK